MAKSGCGVGCLWSIGAIFGIIAIGTLFGGSESKGPKAPEVVETPITDRAAEADPRPPFDPPDPNQEQTKRPFNMAFIAKLRRAHSLADVQRLPGSKGKITERKPHQELRSVSYHWVSERGDFMLLVPYEDGAFGISVLNDEVRNVTINSFGSFICDKCKPPINICGARPSWIGADGFRMLLELRCRPPT